MASIKKSKSNKNPSIRNRPKFVYHTVPGSSINYISNEAMRDENISHLLTDERKPYLHTIDSISGGSDKLSDRPQIPMIVIKDRQRRSHKRIETSFRFVEFNLTQIINIYFYYLSVILFEKL